VPSALNAVVEANGTESLPVEEAKVKDAAAARPPPLLNCTCVSEPATDEPAPPSSVAQTTLPLPSVVSVPPFAYPVQSSEEMRRSAVARFVVVAFVILAVSAPREPA